MINTKLHHWVLLFAFGNIFLFFFILFFSSMIPFNFSAYQRSHHFIQRSSFLNSLAVYDAQWYLKIAKEGYPKNPTIQSVTDVQHMDGLTYSYFPLYPMILGIFRMGTLEIEVLAFTIMLLLLIMNFYSLTFVLTKLTNTSLALKTTLLLFTFPLSIFYRSYYTEGIFLFLLVWFIYFLWKKELLYSALLLGLLNVTKGNAVLFNLMFLIVLIRLVRENKISFKKSLLSITAATLPFLSWMYFCYKQTGDPLYFVHLRSEWSSHGIFSFIPNIMSLFTFSALPLHSNTYSQVEIIMVFVVVLVLTLSKRALPPLLWWTAICLCLTPLLVTDLTSFTRYQIVSFPIFLYLAKTFTKTSYTLLLITFLFGLMAISLFFVNWYWIG